MHNHREYNTTYAIKIQTPRVIAHQHHRRLFLDPQARYLWRVPARERASPEALPCQFDFRYNERIALGIDDTERTIRALQGIVGKRLTYRGPDGTTA